MEDHDGAHDGAARVEDRRCAVLDRTLRPVARDQRGVIREAHDAAARKHLLDGVFCSLPRVFVDDPEHAEQRLPLRFAERPPCHGLGHRIQEGHEAIDVCRDHGVADAGQGDLVPLSLLLQLPRLALQRLVRRHEVAFGALARLQNFLDVLERRGP
jgi:hypothetical protein